jgi:hypothetical protein
LSAPPDRTTPKEHWEEVLSKDGSGFRPHYFPNKLETEPTPLGWCCVTDVEDDDFKKLIDEYLDKHTAFVDRATIAAEFLFFTSGIGFLIIRAGLAAGLDLESPNIKYWVNGDAKDDRFLRKFAEKYVDRFRSMLKAQKCREFEPLQRELPRSRCCAKIVGTYLVFFLEGFELVASRTIGMEARTSRVPGKGVSMLVEWDMAWAWADGTSATPAEIATACSVVDTATLVANSGWFAFVLMDDFLTEKGEDFLLKRAGGRKGKAKDLELNDVRLGYLQAAEAMRPLRWTRWSPHLELLSLIHRVWETAERWRSVEQRLHWLAAYQQEREEDRRQDFAAALTLVGLLLAAVSALSVASIFADVFTLYYLDTETSWDDYRGRRLILAILFGVAPLLLAVVLFFRPLLRLKKWRRPG